MDITNMQNFLLNQVQASIPAFGGKTSATVSQSKQKTDSFASKLNTAVERSANGNSAIKNDSVRQSADMKKPAVFNDENITNNESQPRQTTGDDRTDIPNAIGSEQLLPEVKPEIPDEFLGAASLMAQMPAIANIISENNAVQVSTLQDGFFRNFPEKQVLSLTAEDLKGLPPEIAKMLENMLANAGDTAKGRVIPQAAVEEFLAAAKQELDTLAAKGELSKINEQPELPISNRQPSDTAKQPQDVLQLAKSMEALAKLEAGLAKTETELQKPVVEFTKMTVIDAAKPMAENAKPNLEQQSAVETTVLTLKDSAEQNLANRQNTGGQQSFAQMAEPNSEQIKSSDQPGNTTQPFAVFSETTPQSQTEKLVAAQPQQTSDFTTPRDEFQIKEQIVQQAIMINRSAQDSEMIIRLKPEHLGDMALKVTVTNGVVNAVFHSNNAEVRSILENSLQQLKNDLTNAGFKVDNVSISAGLSQFSADQERAMQWQQQQTRRFSGKTGEEGYADAVEGISTGPQVINASKDDGVDYRI